MEKTILKSSTGSLGPLFSTASGASDLPIVNVPIDTKGLNPVDILITFNASIYMPRDVDANLIFIIKKYEAKSSPQLIGSSYVFSNSSTTSETDTFAFNYTDTGVNPGKYNYSIQLSSVSLTDYIEGIVISNATLSILAVGQEEKKGSGNDSKGSSNNSKGGNSSSDGKSNSDKSDNGKSDSSNNSSDKNNVDADSKDKDKDNDNANCKSKDKDKDNSKDKDNDKKDKSKENKDDKKDKNDKETSDKNDKKDKNESSKEKEKK